MFRTLFSSRRDGGWLGAAILVSVVVLVSGCGTDREKSRVEKRISALESFLQDGATRRDEVMVRLGIPHATFENERIIGYYLSARDELILVFDANGRLARHRFLKFPTTQP